MVPAFFKSTCPRLFLLLAVLSGIAPGQSKSPSGPLPLSFSGWRLDSPSVKVSRDPVAADATDAPVLKEYGFTDLETATYNRNGRKMLIKAARFNDATGAFGAFTYYVQPQMQVEKIGDRGASSNTRILFFKGNILVDVSVEHLSAMSGADLRSLADALPRLTTENGKLPTLPANLPSQSLLRNTSRYIIGPEALARLGVPIPAQIIDFSKSAEVAIGKYRTSQGEASVILVGYPTPQIARERMDAMQAASLTGGPFYFKRTGPYVVAVNGNIPTDEAQSLLASVNYDADVMPLQPTKPKPGEDRAGFVFALMMLCVIAVLAALVFGFVFGGVRILANRMFPNRVFSRPESVEIIRLN
ncbi:MAG TPA: DUF6599 family protein, partial [Candidatus Angelobacter sp.]|nr:DUF6599 family protein [Candidatus Angelobacter sp.]